MPAYPPAPDPRSCICFSSSVALQSIPAWGPVLLLEGGNYSTALLIKGVTNYGEGDKRATRLASSYPGTSGEVGSFSIVSRVPFG